MLRSPARRAGARENRVTQGREFSRENRDPRDQALTSRLDVTLTAPCHGGHHDSDRKSNLHAHACTFLRRVRVEARGCVAGPVSYAPVCPICDALAITWHRCASAPVQLMEQKRKEAEERKKKEDVERERRRKQGGRRRSSARRPSAAAGYETQPLRLPAWRCIHVTQRHESLRVQVPRALRSSGHHRIVLPVVRALRSSGHHRPSVRCTHAGLDTTMLPGLSPAQYAMPAADRSHTPLSRRARIHSPIHTRVHTRTPPGWVSAASQPADGVSRRYSQCDPRC